MTGDEWLFLNMTPAGEASKPARPRDFRPNGRMADLARVTPREVRMFSLYADRWIGECSATVQRAVRAGSCSGWRCNRDY